MIVVDASILTEALIDDGQVGAAARQVLHEDSHWTAPGHLLVEVVSSIRGRVLGGKLDTGRGDDAIEALGDIAIDSVGTERLVPRIWQLRDDLTAYDAAYVAAAEELSCPLVTSDARLARAEGARCQIRLVRAERT